MNTTLPPSLQPDDFCALTDGMTNIIRALKGSPESGFGSGIGLSVPIDQDYGYSRAAREYEATLLGIRHFPTTSRLLQKAHAKTVRAGQQMIVDYLYELLGDLSNVCAATELGPTSKRHMDVVGYASYFNTGAGGPWKGLVSREFADVFEGWFKGTKFGAHSVYSPAIENMASRRVGSEVALGGVVDPERFAGLPVRVRVSDFAGDGGMFTVVAAGRTEHGGVIPDARVWSARVGGDGTFDLVPDVGGDLCLAVRNVGLPAGATAGTFVIEGLLPERLR